MGYIKDKDIIAVTTAPEAEGLGNDLEVGDDW
jgi:hypothetical protein